MTLLPRNTDNGLRVNAVTFHQDTDCVEQPHHRFFYWLLPLHSLLALAK